MDFSPILLHPDKEEIVTKLLTGILPKEISQWLRLKYTDKEEKHLHIPIKLLEEYNKTHIGNLMEHLQRDKTIAQVENPGQEIKVLSESLLNNKTYKARLLELADIELDARKMIKDLILTIQARMEQVFDRIQENPTNFKGDYVLIKYFELLSNAIEKFDKIVNHTPDQIIQHNVSIQMVDKYKAVFQEAVRKTLAQIDNESAMLFIEILGKELVKLESPDAVPTVKEVMLETKALKEVNIAIREELDE